MVSAQPLHSVLLQMATPLVSRTSTSDITYELTDVMQFFMRAMLNARKMQRQLVPELTRS
jgi:hypothetical protein